MLLWMVMLSAAQAAVLELHRGVSVHEWLNWSPIEADGSYKWPPYRSEVAWLSGARDFSDWPPGDVFEMISGLGFDFVRLTIDPGPLLATTGARRREALQIISDAARRISSTGLKVVLDLHAVEQLPKYGLAFIDGGPVSPGVAAYQDMVAAVASLAVDIGSDRVALEPFNEPSYYPCDGHATDGWQQIMAATIHRIRMVSKELTIVATGACGGGIAGLLDLDPRFDDADIYYSFHMYEPHEFTHQGLASDDEFLSGLPWPAVQGTADDVVRKLREHMSEDGIGASQQAEKLRVAMPEIEQYFMDNSGQPQLEANFDAVARWAEAHGIPTQRLLMGEFGAGLMSDDYSRGAFEADRSRYLEAVRLQAERRKIPWAVWEFSNPFGMSVIEKNGPAVPDQGLLKALGLHGQ